MENLRAYRIVRFYSPHLQRRPRTIKTGLTRSEAEAHCKDPRTRKDGEYFDGFDLMKGVGTDD